MASGSKKRKKTGITSLDNPRVADSNMQLKSNQKTRTHYKCPMSVQSVFKAHQASEVEAFYHARTYKTNALDFEQLPGAEVSAWTESYLDNRALTGFIIYATVFPKLLKTRIKLNSPEYHWNSLDYASKKGRVKLEERKSTMTRLKSASAASVYKGIACNVADKNILHFMGTSLDEEDERYRFLSKREFSKIYADRGSVGSSSVYTSCCLIISLLHFSTFVLGRPCSLEAIVLPLTVREREMLERIGCPSHYFDGPVKKFHTTWRDVFSTLDKHFVYETVDYATLDIASFDRYIEGVHLADVYAVYRATVSAPDDPAAICSSVESYKAGSKQHVDTSAIVGIFDVIRDKSSDAIGRLDERDLASIYMSFGQKAYEGVQRQCDKLDSSIFGCCVSNKVIEVMAHFDRQQHRMRARNKLQQAARANVDPAGISKKVDGQRMLDPRDPESKQTMLAMLKALCNQVWKPLRYLAEKFDGGLCYASTFLQMSDEQTVRLHKYMELAGVQYCDIANLYIILVLSFSFQRSQVIRQSMVDEFTLVANKSRYKLSFKRRTFKTATSTGNGSLLPVSHFELTTEQSMIVKFIHSVGHRFTALTKFDPTRGLLLNSNAQGWTQHDISSRFKQIGKHWLGIDNFGVHTCRTFWSTDALSSGAVDSDNIGDFSSFLQVSRQTMENSYMSSTANSTAHAVGSQVLGAISHAVCTGSTSAKGSRPKAKKLGIRRLCFADPMRASLAKYSSARELFRAVVQKRKADTLPGCESWFKWDSTFFDDADERFFLRFMAKL